MAVDPNGAPDDPKNLGLDRLLGLILNRADEQVAAEAEVHATTLQLESEVVAALQASGVDLDGLLVILRPDETLFQLAERLLPPEEETVVSGEADDPLKNKLRGVSLLVSSIVASRDRYDMDGSIEHPIGSQADIYADPHVEPEDKIKWLTAVAALFPDIDTLDPTDPEYMLRIQATIDRKNEAQAAIEKHRSLTPVATKLLTSFIDASGIGYHDGLEDIVEVMATSLTSAYIELTDGNESDQAKKTRVRQFNVASAWAQEAGWTEEQLNNAVAVVMVGLQDLLEEN